MYVIIVGGVTTSAAIALGASLFPACSHVLSLANRDEVIGVAENSAEFATRKLNQLLKSEGIEAINAARLSPPETMTNKAEVTLVLTEANLDKLKIANLYSSEKFKFDTGTSVSNPIFKILNVTANKHGYKHTISMILAPVYLHNSGSTPFFSNAVEVNHSFSIGDGIKIGMENGNPIGANVSVNGLATIGTNSKIDGNLQVYTPGDGSPQTSIKSPTTATIGGNVSSSGNIVNSDGTLTPPLTSDSSTDGNVLGDGKPGADPVAGEVGPNDQPSFSPGVDVPLTTNMAQISYSGSDLTGFSMPQGSTTTSVADLGRISIKSGETLTLGPGVYVADSVSVESGGTLRLVGGESSATSGAKIYIQGNSSNASPVDFQGNLGFDGAVPKSPNNFQLFYNGSKSVTFSLPDFSSFRGLVYSPNASMAIKLGTKSSFHGAIVANEFSLSHLPGAHSGQFLFNNDAAATSSTPSGVASGPSYSVTSGATDLSVQSYRVVTWQEFPNK